MGVKVSFQRTSPLKEHTRKNIFLGRVSTKVVESLAFFFFLFFSWPFNMVVIRALYNVRYIGNRWSQSETDQNLGLSCNYLVYIEYY